MYKFEVDRLWSFAVSAETSRSQLHSAVPRHDRRQQCRQRTEAGREGKLRPARRTGQWVLTVKLLLSPPPPALGCYHLWAWVLLLFKIKSGFLTWLELQATGVITKSTKTKSIYEISNNTDKNFAVWLIIVTVKVIYYPPLFRLQNDLYCVEWGVKLYSLTHSLPTTTSRNGITSQ